MPFYTVYTPPEDSLSGDLHEKLSRAEVMKDGFSIPAFAFTGLWLLSKKLWLSFLLFALVYGSLALMQMKLGLSAPALVAAQFGLGLFLGLEGHSIWGAKLRAKGWQFADVVEARNKEEAERRFFERALAEPALLSQAPLSPPTLAPPTIAPLRAATPQQVIGMFQEAPSRW